MMRHTTKTRYRYGAGERGRNRVWTFPDPKTGIMQFEWREGGRRRQKSLGHRDWELAKTQADRFAAEFREPRPDSDQKQVNLGKLFDIYRKEVTPTKGERAQKHDRVTLQVFEDLLGRDRDPMSLSKRDWTRFVDGRREGKVGPSGARVSDRTVERDLKLLVAVMNWATEAKDIGGRPLLGRNPLKGLKAPKEKNPLRVVISEVEYLALLEASMEVDWRFHVALVLAHESGHRIGAIRHLRWADVDMETASILWRAEHEKTGYEHVTPLTPEAIAALELARGFNPGTGDTPVLPAPRDANHSVGRYLMRDWWQRAEKLAGLTPRKGRGWHSLRRKFASDLMHKPLKVLCELGGWKSAETVLQCYQHADQDQLREALTDRRRH